MWPASGRPSFGNSANVSPETEESMFRIAVCVSGGGTNLQAIIDGVRQGAIPDTEIVRVIGNNRNAYALERAGQAGIEAVCVSPRDYEDREKFNRALLAAVDEAAPDLIVLAGGLPGRPAAGAHTEI